MQYVMNFLLCSIRLFAIVRYESVFNEHDPYFSYRATVYLVKEGFFDFMNWIDSRSWYPVGRIVGQSYPGLISTSALVHGLLNYIGFSMNVRNTCVYLAPIFSGATACSTFLLASEVRIVPLIPATCSSSYFPSHWNEILGC